jgi:polar amino acid transport system substrate-binding protein
MLRKKYIVVILIVISVLMLASCNAQKKYTSLKDLEKATFAVPSGTVADKLVLSRLPNAKFTYYNNVMECIQALKDGKVDAVAYDEPILKYIAASEPELKLIDEKITIDDYGFAVNLNRQDLKKAIDETISELIANGTYDQITNRWLPEQGSVNESTMPNIELTEKNGTLKFGTAAVVPPVSFVSNNTITGMTIEVAMRIAQKLGMNIEIIDMPFGELIPSVASGKVDMAGAAITITAERSKLVLFSEPTYKGGISAIVKK